VYERGVIDGDAVVEAEFDCFVSFWEQRRGSKGYYIRPSRPVSTLRF